MFVQPHNYSTTSVVTMVGSIILARQIDKPEIKYKRKDCPVCKGKGWYISGDTISKVPCGYCEPDTAAAPNPPSSKSPNCSTGKCPTPSTIYRLK